MPDFDDIPDVGARAAVTPAAEITITEAAPEAEAAAAETQAEIAQEATEAASETSSETVKAEVPADAEAPASEAEKPAESAEAPGAQSAVSPEFEAAKAALLATAQALGITETDIAKIPALIAERNAQASEARVAEQQAGLEARWKAEAEEALGPLALDLIGNQLLAEGFENLPQTTEAWEAPENADIKARYFQLRAELEARPEWAQHVQEGILSRRVAHQDNLSKITAKYPHAAVDLVNGLRDHGATPDFLETVARQTHLSVERAVSTLNSEFAALKSEAEGLRAQVSGHAEALAKAEQKGRAEGRNAAIEEVKKGLVANPASVGLGAPTPEQAPGYKPRGIGWDTIPNRTH